MVICDKNTLIFWDSFAGLLKGKVISTGRDLVTILITSKRNKIYPYGYQVTTLKTRVFPRDCYHKTGIFTYYVTDFDWSR